MSDGHLDHGDAGETTPRVEARVVVLGAAGGLMLAMTCALANVVLAAQDPKPQGALAGTYIGVLAGFLLAGFVAGHEAEREAVRHGTWAALVAYVPVELVAVLGRLDRGDPVSLFAIVLPAGFAALAGTGGARLGARRRATVRARSTEPGGSVS